MIAHVVLGIQDLRNLNIDTDVPTAINVATVGVLRPSLSILSARFAKLWLVWGTGPERRQFSLLCRQWTQVL